MSENEKSDKVFDPDIKLLIKIDQTYGNNCGCFVDIRTGYFVQI